MWEEELGSRLEVGGDETIVAGRFGLENGVPVGWLIPVEADICSEYVAEG